MTCVKYFYFLNIKIIKNETKYILGIFFKFKTKKVLDYNKYVNNNVFL